MFETSGAIVSRPKSARQARPAWLTRILALINEARQRERERERERLRFSKTYSFEIAVDHSLAVHMDQTPRNVSQLPKPVIVSNRRGYKELEWITYEFKSVLARACCHKLDDVPVRHPLRHHSELIPGHPHS